MTTTNGMLTCKDAWGVYSKQLIAQNPARRWGLYDKRTSNYYVYEERDGKPVEIMNYGRFREIIETYFFKAQEYIITGYALNLGSNLGRIAGRRAERNYSNKVVDWKRSKELWAKKGERKGLVYHLGEEWVRIAWKKAGKVKHCSLYEFVPAAGNTTKPGFKDKFSLRNMQDPTLKMRYDFFAYVK